jgi:putative sigma-54 modulation protein
MRLVLTGRHLDISPGLRTLVNKKLTRLERTLGDAIVSAQVVCVRHKDRLEADVSLHMRGDHVLAGRASGDTWQSVLTAAVDKIARQGSRVKGKWKGRKRRAVKPGSRQEAAALAAPAVDGQPRRLGPKVVRVTRTALKPMTVETAAIELAASGEPYLVFRNAESDALSVLLRRDNGDFGLLEPGR